MILDAVESGSCDWTLFYDSDTFPNHLAYGLNDMRTRWRMQYVCCDEVLAESCSDDASILIPLDPPEAWTRNYSNASHCAASAR